MTKLQGREEQTSLGRPSWSSGLREKSTGRLRVVDRNVGTKVSFGELPDRWAGGEVLKAVASQLVAERAW